jgi:hypothetical protein
MSRKYRLKELNQYPDKEFQVGLAEDDMGKALGDFLYKNGEDFGDHSLNWDRVYPYWVVAVGNDGDIWGALNIVHSLPLGRVEMLTYKKDLVKDLRRQIINELAFVAIATLVENGSQLGACTVSESDQEFLQWLKVRGAMTGMTDGHILLWRFPNGFIDYDNR